jgi:alkanesulfonate monooxygenase SsuD/methylene tetrahydromethanopterin reductase-like flavin-dependent oxidoreductase (luciferase family)
VLDVRGASRRGRAHLALARGPDPPREYLETFDPLITLTAVAADLRLGTGVSPIIERDPIFLAKELATLDVLSGGRPEVGVGVGVGLEEIRNRGTGPETRFRLMRERVEAVRTIWTEDLRRRRGPGALKRTIAYGDGWSPSPKRRRTRAC